MSLKLGYLLRETFSNLWRNVSLTIAAVITVLVSLSMFGAALMVGDGVDNATERWEGGIEFVVWLNPDIDAAQDSAIEETLLELQNRNQIDRFDYVDQEATYQEFLELFADSPETLEAVEPANMPPSYRVVPTDPDAEVISELASQFRERAGVRDVVLATEVIKEVQRTADRISQTTLIFSVVLVIAAVLLILNTIIMAISARRREIEVMKLVGATNWFIRLPFMFEGLIFGLIGAGLSIPAMIFIRSYLIEPISDTDALALLQGFEVSNNELMNIIYVNLGLGIIVAVVGSAVAVSRHLDV
ncbi:MAG: ABC transporter permease [Acidimicrobiia bacterium]|nr:ABC transporter permease [Acidimicrobiia bacterium]